MGVAMVDWPWKSRKARIEEGWNKVRTAVEAWKAEHQAVLELADKINQEGTPKRQAYLKVLEDFMDRKRGLNEQFPPIY